MPERRAPAKRVVVFSEEQLDRMEDALAAVVRQLAKINHTLDKLLERMIVVGEGDD